MKCIVFHGDSSSKTIKIGWFFKKLFGKLIYIDLWDGYKSGIWIAPSINRRDWK